GAGRRDPGTPADCNSGTLHRFSWAEARLAWVCEGCTTAGIGCLDCKKALAENVSAHLAPIRARKAELLAQPGRVEEILRAGAARARTIAQETLREVRRAVGLWL